MDRKIEEHRSESQTNREQKENSENSLKVARNVYLYINEFNYKFHNNILIFQGFEKIEKQNKTINTALNKAKRDLSLALDVRRKIKSSLGKIIF